MFVSQALNKPPGATVNPMAWQADPQAGIPIIIGHCYAGGKIVYRQTFGKNNVNQTINTVYSAGPIAGFQTFYVDGVATTISAGGQANITDRGKMFVATQLGARPEARQLGGTNNPGITAASKLSGLAASTVTLSYDAKGGTTFTTEPQVGWTIYGRLAYDARKDSTYPGGNGPQRADDETTWTYSTNPGVLANTWLIGWRDNGKLVAGVGCNRAAILTAQLVELSNICDANGWTLGGEMSTTDDKWQRYKDILQAGGAEPLRLGAQIGCIINTPRVSIGTIGVGDVVGDASVQATQARRDRINAIVPRYMAEQSVTTANSSGGLVTTTTWGMVPGSPVVVADYVAFDGRQRQKEVEYTFVQNLNQSQQLARYDIENSREFGPIMLPLKLRWMGYRPGDVVTANLPELGLVGQDILILSRTLSPQNGTVTITARSETAGKHAFALGQTGTPPATPTVSGPALVPTPGNADWTVAATTIQNGSTSVPAIVVKGAADTGGIDGIVFELRVYTGAQGADDDWHAAGIDVPSATTKVLTEVIASIQYQVSVRYRWNGSLSPARLILGPVTAGFDSAAQTYSPTNRVAFSRAEKDGYGWSGGYNPSNLPAPVLTGEAQGRRYISIQAAATAAGQVVTLITTIPFPVTPGEKLCVAGWLEADQKAQNGNCKIRYKDANGNDLAAPYDDVVAFSFVGQVGYYAQRGVGFLTVPPAAVKGVLEYGAISTGAGNYNLCIVEPLVCSVPDAQTAPPPFVPGPNAVDGSDVTGQNTALDTSKVNGQLSSDVTAAIATANSVASSASTIAGQAKQFADDVADNSKFSSDEKKRWVQAINSWQTDVPNQVAKAISLGFGTEASALSNAFTTLVNYLNQNHYSNVGSSDHIDRGFFQSTVGTFTAAETALSNALNGYAGLLASHTTANVFLDPRFERPTDTSAWASFDNRVVIEDANDGRRVRFPPGLGGDAALVTERIVFGPTDRLDIEFEYYWQSGAGAGNSEGGNAGIFTGGYNGDGSGTNTNPAVTVNASTAVKDDWTTLRGTVPAGAHGGGVASLLCYIQAQPLTGGSVYIRNPRAYRVVGANTNLSVAGRGTSALLNSTSILAGIKALNLTGFQLSQSNASGSVTVNCTSSQYRADTGLTLNYPSASFTGLSYSTFYYFWRNDPNLNGGTGYGYSTNIADASAPGQVYLGYILTMDAAGTGGGGGGGGGERCVDPDMFLEVEGRGPVKAKDVVAGDRILCLTEDHTGTEYVEVTHNAAGQNLKCRLTAASGEIWDGSINTPVPRRDGSYDMAMNAWVGEAPVGASDRVEWATVTVEALRFGAVQQISCHSRVFAAGAEPARYIFTHNALPQKP